MGNVGVWRRALGWLVDAVISTIWTAPLAERVHTPGHVEYRLMNGRFLTVTLIWIAYTTLMETAFGATVGKFVVGIRVVRSDGGRIDVGAALIRNVARVVDGFPYFLPYLVGAIAVWTSPANQRLGDRWAHTVVVRRGSQPAIAPDPSPPPAPPMPPMPPAPLPPTEG